MTAINPTTIRPPFARYSHGMTDATGQWLLTSGQLGVHADDSVPESPQAQAELCFANLEAILLEATMGKHHILRLNAFVSDRSYMPGYMAARDAWLANINPPPASTLMIVTGFTRAEFKIEIELIAYRD